jgi:hypothetical protein
MVEVETATVEVEMATVADMEVALVEVEMATVSAIEPRRQQ